LAAVRRGLLSGTAFAVAGVLACADDFQGATHMMPFEEDSINYNNAVATNAVAQLQKQIDTGASTLKHEDAHG